MTTTAADDNSLKGLIIDIMFTPPVVQKDYRYYHCRLDCNGLKCKKVTNSTIIPSKDYTKLLFIKSYIPERFDKTILKYKWIPDKVYIEDNST